MSLQFFIADDGTTGQELWVTDGSVAGTFRLRDINPGMGSANIGNLLQSNGIMYFTAYDGSASHMWRSDGTTAGTYALTSSINGDNAGNLVNVNGRLFFTGSDSVHGAGLFVTDGTTGGTQFVQSISSASQFFAVGNSLFFTANDSTNGTELWVSDGTAGGTHIVKDVLPGAGSSSYGNFTALDGKLYFTASNGTDGTEVWVSDGTAAGTFELKDINNGSNGSNATNFYAANGHVFFTANDGAHGNQLWSTDGTTGNTHVLTLGTGQSPLMRANTQIIFNHTLYYVGTDPSGGLAIFTSDGSTLTKLTHLSSFSGKFYNLGATLMFFGNDGTHGSGLYTFDGTAISFVSSVSGGFTQPVLSGGNVFFISHDATHGNELWVTDGTAAGTHITADINPGVYDAQIANISAVNGGVAFTAYRPDVGTELFFSDGTTAGTGLLANANPTGDHTPSLGFGSTVYQAGALGFFAGNDGVNGYELWVTDGTTGGSHMVTDLQFGSNGSNPQSFFVAGNAIYFTADDGTNGRQLYTSDGTTVTQLTSGDLDQPYNDAGRFFTIGGTFYYMAYDSSANGGGFALYSSNGTVATTTRVGKMNFDTPLHVGSGMILHGDDGAHGGGLYSFSGTGAPTLIANIGNYEYPVVSGNNLFWRSSDGGNGYELWTTNGTSTHLVTNINPGPYDSYPDHIIGLGDGRVVFTAFNPSTGNEVYVSDGTAGGTTLLLDVNPTGNHGQSLNFNSNVVTASALTFFAGEDGIHGNELWVSDGTSAHMVTDLIVGGSSSSPQGLFSAGGKIYFTADDGTNGRQLYTSDGTTVTQLTTAGLDQPYNDAGRFFTIGGTFYYMAYDSSANGGGFALYSSNGTVATTTRVGKMNFDTPLHVGGGMILHGDDGMHGSGLYAFSGTGAPTFIGASGNYENPVVSGTNVFWRGYDGTNGYELWTTNGTSTHLVTNINPGPYDSYPDHIIGLGDGRVVFTAFNPSTGNEVYVSDGTAGGTTLLLDVNPTGNHGQSLNFNSNVVTASALTFFAGEDGIHGNELWVSDGTSAHMVTDLIVGGSSSSPQGLFSAGGKIYFTADDGTNGRQLYTSDGTTVTQLTTAGLDQPYNDAGRFFTIGGTFYYMAYDSSANGGGFALYSSNGTVATTTRVGKMNFDTPLHVGGGMILHGDDGMHGSGLYAFSGTGAPTFIGASGNYENPVVSGTNVFWRGYDGTNGYELWSTNGTTVQMVKDINPGGNWSYPSQITSLGNGSVVFIADDGSHGGEVWVSDGTSAGTTLLADLFPGGTGSSPDRLIQAGSQVFFTANYFSNIDGAHGTELFVTDGTAVGTHMVRDINPGSDSTSFGSMFAFGGKLYFAAYKDGWHTYVTDGTDAGTHIMAPGDGSSTGPAGNFLAADATHFYFTGDSGLFYSDGTDAGTVNIGSSRGFDINHTTYANGQLIYQSYDDTNGYELWTTNGTVAGTHRLTDTIIPNSSNATGFVFSGGKVYFYADDGVHGGNELFVTDGTTAGTHLLNDFNGAGGTSYGSNFAFGGKFYFTAYDPASGWHTYVTNGTGTPHAIAPGDGSSTGPGGNFLAADATHFYFTGDSGLFYSDGTDAGTINIGSSRGFDLNTASISNGHLLYRLYDDTNGYELWSTDGTTTSTHRLTDTLIPNSSNATGFVFSGGKVYFYADDGVHGANELFVTDGTTAGTHLLNDFSGAAGTSYGSNFAFGGKFYFTAYDSNSGGWHTYVTNGTGTPHAIAPGDGSSTGPAGNFLAADATHFFFTGDAGLFYSDGTDAGTHLIGDTRGFANASVVNGVLYYQHYDDTNGYELWESNGTVAGTMRLTDTQIPNSSNPGSFSPIDNSPPTVANATVTAITDQQTNHPFQNVVIGDSDAPAQTLTVTITPDDPAKGGFTTASLTASGFVAGGINGSYTFTGTAAQSTAAIDALIYQPVANRLVVGASETMNFTIAVNDGAGGSVVNHVTSITQTSANDAPIGSNDSGSINEDATIAVTTRATGVLANDHDADLGETPGLTVTGAHAGAVADTTVAASGKTTIHGTYGDLHLAADGTYDYTPNSAAAEALAVGQTGTEVFRYTVTDVHGANGTATLTFTITGQEDAPVATADTRAVFEDATSSANTRAGGLLGNDTDVDNGETATLKITGAHFGAVGDTAVAASGQTTIHGTYGDLLLAADGTYSYTPTTAAAEALPQGQAASDAFSYTIVDAQGQSATSTMSFNVTGTNDAPLGTNDVAAAVNEDATVSASTRAAGVLGNDTDVDNGETATLRVSGAHFGAAADTVVAASGTTVIHGLYGDLSIAANGTYSYTPNSPAAEALALGQTASDVFSYTVADVNSGTGTASLTFNITGQNDAPTATLASGMNAVEQMTYDLKGKIAIGDVDSGNPVETATLSVGYGILHLAAGTSGATITANDAATVTVSGTLGQLSALFGSDATSVATYYADTDTPPASVALNVSVTDDHNANGATSATVIITPVDDPAVAVSDTNAVLSDQSIVAASVFGNDYDVDGPALQVAAVNGVAGNVGSQFTLPSGALLTMRANGTYDYSPNHAFDSLTAITGATNHTGTDSFTYVLVNGNAATVTITVTGSPNSTAPGYGSAGNDVMTGTSHDDFFDLRQGGSDTASGLGGNDTFYMGAAWNAGDVIDGGGGTADQVIAQGNTNLTLGTNSLAAIEQLTLLTGSDPTYGDVFGFPYSYNITTNDANVAAGQQFTVQGGSLHANETLTFNGSAELDGSFLIYGGLGNDVLTGGAGDDTIYGGGGNDRLNGSLGADTMAGGVGNDTYVVDNAGDIVVENAGEGADTVESSVDYALGANVENLALTGTGDISGAGNAGANVITGNSGNNSLVGNGGADTLIGGAGDDIYTVSDAATVIVENAGEGNDTVKSSVSYVLGAGVEIETARLIGASNIDLTGNEIHQVLIGNTGNNVLDGGGGGDRMKGGAGNDTYIVRSAADTIVEIAGDGDDMVKATLSYTLGAAAQVEHLYTVDALATTAINLTGNDYSHDIQGNAGVNVLTGGSGNDTLSGNGGADTLAGGLGDDIYAVTDAATTIVEAAGGGNDTVKAFVSYVLTAGAEIETARLIGSANLDLTGNEIHQVLIGNLGNNTLDGGGGGDRMKGGAGDDTYIIRSGSDVIVEIAGDGNDTAKAAVSYTLGAAAQVEHLFTIDASATTAINLTGNDYSHDIQGNAGANVLTGGSGDDVLQGFGGNDTLTGGGGADKFVFGHGTGQDSVGDFVSGSDKLDLSAFGFANFADVQAATHDVDGNAVIDLGGGDALTLTGFLSTQLQSGDVILSGGGGQAPLKAGTVDVQHWFATDATTHAAKGFFAHHFLDYDGLASLPMFEHLL